MTASTYIVEVRDPLTDMQRNARSATKVTLPLLRFQKHDARPVSKSDEVAA